MPPGHLYQKPRRLCWYYPVKPPSTLGSPLERSAELNIRKGVRFYLRAQVVKLYVHVLWMSRRAYYQTLFFVSRTLLIPVVYRRGDKPDAGPIQTLLHEEHVEAIVIFLKELSLGHWIMRYTEVGCAGSNIGIIWGESEQPGRKFLEQRH